ncbi:MAG TPA: polyprenol phosphomannose-dependent alpha 1,6 mannosyltransferase MptB, partial [Pseudonocardiaceae bacterium]|nr:polyprenol phosphomannose-dependent alpha 1,6 mannosyltransferase MptB [Pseudonocardiaceae bacterium]
MTSISPLAAGTQDSSSAPHPLPAPVGAGNPDPGHRDPGHRDPGHLPRQADELRLLDRLRTRPLLSGTVVLGSLGSLLLVTMAVGAGGILITDPLITGGPLSWIRYGHGRDLATIGLYLGLGMLVWAWVRLGREVLAGTATARHVLAASVVWMGPMLVSPPLFTRDVYSYLAQGALALRGLDPYEVGPSELPPGPVADNVHYVWQTTPAPYGPAFILIAKIMSWLTAEDAILGVIGMRLVLLAGLGLLVFVLPRLADELGGKRTVALWLMVANPMTVIHLVGGPHNDLLMIGLLAAGTLLTLQRRHVAGIALVSAAMAVKASAGVALPFLVWIWAARLRGSRGTRLLKAGAASVATFTAMFSGLTMLAGVGLGWIPALDAPSLIVNWMSLPTGAGQLVHAVTSPLHDVSSQPFVDVLRLIGSAVFLGVLAWQWWLARDGGPDAVRRAAIVLLCSAVLAPATLPWYLTWGLALGAALPWRPRALAVVVAASAWLVLCTYPTGESGLTSWPYQLGTVAVSLLAAASLHRRDPLH